jgi:hypothetical protein
MQDHEIKQIVTGSVRDHVNKTLGPEVIEKIVQREMDSLLLETGERHKQFLQWVREALDHRVKAIIKCELSHPEYMGVTWGEPGELMKQVIKEAAPNIVEAMFAKIIEDARQGFVSQLQHYT